MSRFQYIHRGERCVGLDLFDEYTQILTNPAELPS